MLRKKISLLSSIVERDQDILYCLPDVIEWGFSAVALLLSKQRNRLKMTKREISAISSSDPA